MQPQKNERDRKFLGEMLIEAKIVNPAQIEEAVKLQKTSGKKLGQILVEKGIISDRALRVFLQRQFDIPFRALRKNEKMDESLFQLIPQSYCFLHSIIPLNLKNGVLTLAMSDPTDLKVIDEIRFMADSQIEVVLATEESIKVYLSERGKGVKLESPDENHPLLAPLDETLSDEKHGDDAPVVKMVDDLIHSAMNKKASDIHIEALPKVIIIRLRIDGLLYEIDRPKKSIHAALISRLKILADMDISERRLPQDGRITYKLKNKKEIDLRVSIVPTIHGENCVMRILDKDSKAIGLESSGLLQEERDIITRHVHRPNGMILITGPTGSGKTTTLYGILQHIHTPEKKILTIEDPVEYQFDGITQVQAHAEIGLTFASGLRTFLRQDPDVIMVGEIRDQETAEIAIRASLTGHLVLSTVHTNDAPTAVTRLVDMGIESYLVSSTVVLVISQRLVRTLCPKCKVPQKITAKQIGEMKLEKIFKPNDIYYEHKGCVHCNETGYSGRQGIFEILEMNEDIQHLLNEGKSGLEIKNYAIQKGMTTLLTSGLTRVHKGLTTFEEVYRVSI